MPAPRAPAWLTQRPVAHRGFHDAARGVMENSLGAVRCACEAGYAIEVDAMSSRDGVPLVFHDEELERLTAQQGRVEERDAAELMRLHLLHSAETIPSLAQVVETVADRVPLLVEVKPSVNSNAACLRAIAALALQHRRVALMSFCPEVMGFFALQNLTCPLGFLLDDFSSPPPLESLQARHISFLGFNLTALPHAYAAEACVAGLATLTWTVRSRTDAKKALAHSDQIIFEGFMPEVA